ncbi:helix-turn-helix domain-containing protein [Shimia sp.]|uniref:helix-turn-helix domain-containing protein n=1 Tax=Shimia sp. TaxID=1954381 RepID=UPI003298EF56
MPKSLPLVQLQTLAPLLTGLRTVGIDPEAVLESVGLTLSAVEQKGASVHVMVIHQFVENCAKATGDPTFCARIGSQLDPTGWPMIRKAFEQSTTLGDFLNIYVSQVSSVASSVTAFLDVRGDIASFGEERRFEPLILPAQNDGFMIGLKVSILEQALGDQMEPDRVFLVLSDPSVLPPEFGRYQALRGNNMGPRIQFPSEWLSTALSTRRPEVSNAPAPTNDKASNFLDGLRHLLDQNIENGGLSAEDAAGLVHLSKRQLARQLSNMGTNISKEISRAKTDYAKEALLNSSRAVEDIASELGYSDPSNFARAFAKEAKLSPTQFRLHHQRISKQQGS